MQTRLEQDVARHYGHAGLLETILGGVKAAGGNPEKPTIADLAPVDEFHTAGRDATLQLFEMLAPKSHWHVLDAGCGLGGTARALATEHGCQVTGIDLTPEYVEIAKDLTHRIGLEGKCSFVTGSVLALPFADSTFDAAVTCHVGMNVPDRAAFYQEVARTLKPGGRFCVFDVMKGPADGIPFPMPWAENEAASFVRTRDDTAQYLQDAGMTVVAERNLRDYANDYYEKAFAAAAEAGGPPPVGLHLLTGAMTKEKFENVVAAYKAHQTEPVILIAEKSAAA